MLGLIPTAALGGQLLTLGMASSSLLRWYVLLSTGAFVLKNVDILDTKPITLCLNEGKTLNKVFLLLVFLAGQ